MPRTRIGGSRMNRGSRIAACLLTAIAASSVEAQETVTLTGCPTSGIEMGCLVLKQDNVTYDISAAQPKPRVGYRAVRLRGTKSSNLGICQQDVILDTIQWTYTDQKCD